MVVSSLKHGKNAEIEPGPASPPVPEQITDQEILGALDQVSSDFRAVVLLIDVEEFSYKETAGILNVPIGTVMSRLSRGRLGLHWFALQWRGFERRRYRGDRRRIEPGLAPAAAKPERKRGREGAADGEIYQRARHDSSS